MCCVKCWASLLKKYYFNYYWLFIIILKLSLKVDLKKDSFTLCEHICVGIGSKHFLIAKHGSHWGIAPHFSELINNKKRDVSAV